MAISVLLADDHRIFREGLLSLLQGVEDIQVVGEAANGREAVRLAARLRPAVVVMDISMPELNGVEATRQILADAPRARVLVLSMHRDPRYVAGVLEAGAKGYLLKDCAAAELVSVIRTVANGESYLSPQVAEVVVRGFVGRLSLETGRPPASVLSPREREVLQLLAEGCDTRTIADRLHIGVKTVENHRRNLMEKLGLTNLADLIRYALREGVTSLDEWLKG